MGVSVTALVDRGAWCLHAQALAMAVGVVATVLDVVVDAVHLGAVVGDLDGLAGSRSVARSPDGHGVSNVALFEVPVGLEVDANLDEAIAHADGDSGVLPVGVGYTGVGILHDAGFGATTNGGPPPAEDVVLELDGLVPLAEFLVGVTELERDLEEVIVVEVSVFEHLEGGEELVVAVGVGDLLRVGGPDAVGALVVVEVVVAVLAACSLASVEVVEGLGELLVASALLVGVLERAGDGAVVGGVGGGGGGGGVGRSLGGVEGVAHLPVAGGAPAGHDSEPLGVERTRVLPTEEGLLADCL